MGSSLGVLARGLRVVLGAAFFVACFWGPVAAYVLNRNGEPLQAIEIFFLVVMGLTPVLVAAVAVMRHIPDRGRPIGIGPEDRSFRASRVNLRLILGLGLCLLFFAGPLVFSAIDGTDPTQGWHPDGLAMVAVAFGALVVLMIVMPRRMPAPLPVLSAGAPIVATGGSWAVADPSQLIAAPDSSARIHVTFAPRMGFEATGATAILRAVETWVASQDSRARERGIRTNGIQTLVEMPLSLTGPASYRPGQPVDWDLDFTLDGLVPPTCGDIEHLGCRWTLEISIERAGGVAAQFVQPVLVTQPRQRVNSGAMAMPQWSRHEMASGSDGPIRVDFRVSPAPLDLAAPAAVDVTILNSGPPIACRAVRLEVLAQLKATVDPAYEMEQTLWGSSRQVALLPSGESTFHFPIPAINRTWPDADLPHGWLRGAMKLEVDVSSRQDLTARRDLCLCLDKPERRA